MEKNTLPDGLVVSFYGDDFTGSSAVMEVLSFAGLPTILFLEPPTAQDLAQLTGYRAIGIAGVARSKTPEWMDRELPGIFALLAGLDTPVTHYKTCSTLDSSPRMGSIGRAIDLAVSAFKSRRGAADWVPLLVAAPPIGRYQAFGNLFAAYAGLNHRLDRHPVMRRHPATPMDESDVALHVGKQTAAPIGLVDLVAIKSGRGAEVLDEQIDAGRLIVSLDVLDQETLNWAGREMWRRRGGGLFAAGSQGVEYALAAHWRESGLLAECPAVAPAGPVDQVVIASGSVSPITASQIAWASSHGFGVLQLDASKAVSEGAWAAEIGLAVEAAKSVLSSGLSVIIATAQGPDDLAVTRLNLAVEASGAVPEDVHARIGSGLGNVTRQLIEATGLRRVVLAGGDTSGFGGRRLGIKAVTALAPLANGAPLCRVISDDPTADGIEIALKGGQMGDMSFFGQVRAGRAT